MHDRRGEPAWPGYLVGGGWPDGRSWRDELASYKTNEIAINWNAALVYALAPHVQALEVVWEGRVLESGLLQRTETSPALLNYTVANKGTAPLRLDHLEVETSRPDLVLATDLKDGTVLAPGASVEPVFRVSAPGGGQSWEARISIYYNGDTQHPFVWTVRKI